MARGGDVGGKMLGEIDGAFDDGQGGNNRKVDPSVTCLVEKWAGRELRGTR